MSASNRRQPTRSARTTAAHASNYYPRPFGQSRGPAQVEEAQEEIQHGFFPAITHFTDAMAALPKEVMRQFTLLRETEGKGYPFEMAMNELMDKLDTLPPPPQPTSISTEQAYFGFSLTNSINGSAPASIIDGNIPNTQHPPSDDSEPSSVVDEHLNDRRNWHHQLRSVMTDMIGALDEKNIVLTAINETMGRQLSRLETTLPHVEQEVSEEARLGSNTHWALPHMREARKAVGPTNDRHRRDMLATNSLAAAAAAVHESDIAAVRSEARREAIGQRRRQNVDSDFDERQPNKKQHGAGKAKRPQGTHGIDARTIAKEQPQKKRRVDKGPMIQERSMAAAVNGRIPGGRDMMAGALPAAEARKKPKPLPTGGNPRKKPVANSPSLASSPTRGTFATTAKRDYSPAAPAHRPAPRARQNSNMSVRSAANDPMSRTATSSAYPSRPMINGNRVGTPELGAVANAAGKTMGDARSHMRDVYTNVNGTQILEQDDVHGAFVMTNGPAQSLKREETEPADESGYGGGRIRGAMVQPGLPLESVEMDGQPMLRARSSRGNNGHAAQTKGPTASSPAMTTNTFPRRAHEKRYPGRSPEPEDEEEAGASEIEGVASSVDDNEPRYCFCNQPSHGEMVGCDNNSCPREWFHLECVGLREAPPQDTKWYCEECKRLLKRGRSNGR